MTVPSTSCALLLWKKCAIEPPGVSRRDCSKPCRFCSSLPFWKWIASPHHEAPTRNHRRQKRPAHRRHGQASRPQRHAHHSGRPHHLRRTRCGCSRCTRRPRHRRARRHDHARPHRGAHSPDLLQCHRVAGSRHQVPRRIRHAAIRRECEDRARMRLHQRAQRRLPAQHRRVDERRPSRRA
jgi:hypothetical protein